MKKNFFKFGAMLAVLFALCIGGYVSVHPAALFGAYEPVGGTTYRLQSSVGLANTSLTLSSFKSRSGIPWTMSMLNTDIVYATLDPQTSSSEFISFTGITQNSNGTATITGITRGLSDFYPFTASSTMDRPHAGQAIFIVSDAPQVFTEYAAKRNNENISGIFNFLSLPISSVACTDNSQFCNKQYIDSGLNQGAATSSFANLGLVQLATSIQIASSTASSSQGRPLVIPSKFSTSTPGIQCTGGIWNCIPVGNLAGKITQSWLDLTQAFTWTGLHTFNAGLLSTASSTMVATTTASANTVGYNVSNYMTTGEIIGITGTTPVPVSMGTSTPNVFITDANVASTTNFIGFALYSAAKGGRTLVQTDGVVNGFTGLSPGARYYVSDTAGTIQTTVGTSEIYVGPAISATQILIDHGPTAAWQFLGSQSITCTGAITTDTAINQIYARFAVLSGSGSNGDGDSGNFSLTVAKVGITTNAQIFYVSPHGSSVGITATWTATSSLRIADASTQNCTLTAYYYR